VDLVPGTVLLGKYRIDELIGTGGMGNVVRASHLYLHQSVAIKILLPQMSEDPSTVARFLREAQASVKLRSEHSARVVDVGTAPDGTPFMVMEFLDGSDLHQILRHHGRQPPAVAVDLMLQACEGIAEAHALGIIHRDIKPSNFFLTRRPDGSPLLKILDFGISKTPVGYDELTGTQTILGTPSYMAPEQMKSGRSADPRSDLWSIGVVLYQLLTGHPPFAGESYADLVLKVGLEPPEPIVVPLPPGLPEVVLRCLEKDPKLRYQNAGELARAIAPFATDPVSAAHAAGRVVRILAGRGIAPGALLTGGPGAGLASPPIPLSPAQITPGSWSPSRITSLSQGAGQVTLSSRSNRGWLIGGIMSLCVIAGVGGYAISQMSKPEPKPETRNEPHVLAPVPANQPTSEASTAAPVTPASAPAPGPAVKPPAAGAPAAPPATASDAPAAPAATVADHPSAKPVAASAPAPAEDTRPDTGEPRAHEVLIDANPGGKKPAPEPKRTATKPSAEPRPASKPVIKTKKPDDLFDSRH
jgi:serine/threonine-protein kinase